MEFSILGQHGTDARDPEKSASEVTPQVRVISGKGAIDGVCPARPGMYQQTASRDAHGGERHNIK